MTSDSDSDENNAVKIELIGNEIENKTCTTDTLNRSEINVVNEVVAVVPATLPAALHVNASSAQIPDTAAEFGRTLQRDDFELNIDSDQIADSSDYEEQALEAIETAEETIPNVQNATGAEGNNAMPSSEASERDDDEVNVKINESFHSIQDLNQKTTDEELLQRYLDSSGGSHEQDFCEDAKRKVCWNVGDEDDDEIEIGARIDSDDLSLVQLPILENLDNSNEHMADTKKAHRALELLEDYHSRLSDPQDRALRIAIERVIRIFKSRLFQALLASAFKQAYQCQSQCVQDVVKMLQQLKDENWCLPVMYTTCLDLRLLAQKCEKLGNISKPGEILEKAADCLMNCFRVCAADNRSSETDTKRHGMLNVVNQLLRVYFHINKLHLCKPLIRAIENSENSKPTVSFTLPERITYKYFVGRKAMFDSNYKTAEEYLSFALKHCPKNFPRNKRLILIYLVPVKMLLGYMPRKSILERYDLLQFYELTAALKNGNVRKFDEVFQRHERFLIKCGIYLLVEKLKFIVYRNLFKKVYLLRQTHQLNLHDFCAALQFVGETDMTLDETHCIVANLIYEGKIKGYISHSHNKLVVSKQNPFPSLNTVS